jgi:hypothetical protein
MCGATVGGASRGDYVQDERTSNRRAKLRDAAPAHPCAHGIPFILNIKKPCRKFRQGQ